MHSTTAEQIHRTTVAEFLRQSPTMAPKPAPQERPSNRVEIMIGRTLAVSMHPTMAWRLLRPSRRALMVLGYFAVSYVTVLGALQILN